MVIGAGDLGSIPAGLSNRTLSPTAHHRCEVSSEVCCPELSHGGALDPPLVARLGKYREYDEDLIFFLNACNMFFSLLKTAKIKTFGIFFVL